eukprot:SAG11_NODE_858_length_6850_cov_11.886535_7_plen_178_part_00
MLTAVTAVPCGQPRSVRTLPRRHRTLSLCDCAGPMDSLEFGARCGEVAARLAAGTGRSVWPSPTREAPDRLPSMCAQTRWLQIRQHSMLACPATFVMHFSRLVAAGMLQVSSTRRTSRWLCQLECGRGAHSDGMSRAGGATQTVAATPVHHCPLRELSRACCLCEQCEQGCPPKYCG